MNYAKKQTSEVKMQKIILMNAVSTLKMLKNDRDFYYDRWYNSKDENDKIQNRKNYESVCNMILGYERALNDLLVFNDTYNLINEKR
jgi:hypothetical protein